MGKWNYTHIQALLPEINAIPAETKPSGSGGKNESWGQESRRSQKAGQRLHMENQTFYHTKQRIRL